jgi:hypothetical protein
MRRAAVLLLAVAATLLTGCGGGSGGTGAATVWVTRDRGAKVLLTKTVPAGLTAMQALRRVADVKTRYGGRFVQAIEGIEGSLSGQRDWFYFVNGVEADKGAVEYRLRPGDVEWWDYRSWRGQMEQPVVVGSFPEPFLHGYGGKVRAASVRYETKDMRAVAFALANLVGAKSVAQAQTPVRKNRNLLLVVPGTSILTAGQRFPGQSAGSPVVFRISADVGRELVKDPSYAKYRYEGVQ